MTLTRVLRVGCFCSTEVPQGPKLFLFFSSAICIRVSALHSNICQLRVQRWLPQLGVIFSLATQSKEGGVEAPGLSLLGSLLIQKGRPSEDCPVDLIGRTVLSCPSIDQSPVKMKRGFSQSRLTFGMQSLPETCPGEDVGKWLLEKPGTPSIPKSLLPILQKRSCHMDVTWTI